MPHTYMRTTGPTSKGTTARCAVSKISMVIVRSTWRSASGSARPDPLEPQRALALVPQVDGEERGGERLDADGVGQRAGVERAEVGDGVDEVEHHGPSDVLADDQD